MTKKTKHEINVSVIESSIGILAITGQPGKYSQFDFEHIYYSIMNPDLIITLVDYKELYKSYIEEIKQEAMLWKFNWWYLPVKYSHPLDFQRDGYVERGLDRWSVPCALVQEILKRDGEVLIHCWDGHGRSGTLAARVLIEQQNLSAEEAIEKVRVARPGSIGVLQEKYLINFAKYQAKLYYSYKKAGKNIYSYLFAETIKMATEKLLANKEKFVLNNWHKGFMINCECLNGNFNNNNFTKIRIDKKIYKNIKFRFLIERCDICGRLWLFEEIINSTLHCSNIWFRGLINWLMATNISINTTFDYLASLNWYFQGEPNSHGVVKTSGPVLLDSDVLSASKKVG
jgi:hypothetical protein